MNARAHRQTRAHPDTSGLGATNKNHCVHLPAGAMADDEMHCARGTDMGSGGGERRAGLGRAAEPDVTLAPASLNTPQSKTGAGVAVEMTMGTREER